MKIVGQVAELTGRETQLFGCEHQEFVSKLDCEYVLSQLAARQASFDERLPIDGLSFYLYCRDGERLNRDAAVIYHVAGMVVVHELEEALNIPHEPAPEVTYGL
jgi:hypothetical protein